MSHWVQSEHAWHLPRGFYAYQGYRNSYKAISVNLRYQVFKRGWMDGFWGRRRSYKTTAPCRSGEMLHWYHMGWSDGRWWKREINKKPKPPKGPRPHGGRPQLIGGVA